MTISLGQAIAISLCLWFAKASFTPNLTFAGLRPLPGSLLVGLILGDVKTAVAAGIVIELVYIGTMFVGSVSPADTHTAGFLGSALAVCLAPKMGLEAAVGAGLSMAVAVAVPATVLNTLVRTINTITNEKSRSAAEKGDLRMQRFWHIAPGQILVFLIYFPLGLLFLLAMGNATALNAISNVLNPISKYIKVIGAVMPAVGIALCLRGIATTSTLPFVLVGFVLSAYLNMPILGITLVGVVLAFLISFSGSGDKDGIEKKPSVEEIDGDIS